MRDRGFDDPERRVYIGLHRCVKRFGSELKNILALLLATRVASHDIEAAKLGDGFRNELLALAFISEIAGNTYGFSPLSLN